MRAFISCFAGAAVPVTGSTLAEVALYILLDNCNGFGMQPLHDKAGKRLNAFDAGIKHKWMNAFDAGIKHKERFQPQASIRGVMIDRKQLCHARTKYVCSQIYYLMLRCTVESNAARMRSEA